MNIGDEIKIEGKKTLIKDISVEVWGGEIITKVWFIQPSDGKLVYNIPEFIEPW